MSDFSLYAPPTSSRRLTEGLVLSFLLILFLRVFFMEPFGVPTGSMAVTLLGDHVQTVCPNCQARQDRSISRAGRLTCWNCDSNSFAEGALSAIQGDRVLVNKFVYQFRKPRRWESAVFYNPDNPAKPFVKRIVGLPGEEVQIADGDVYINGELARKTLTEAESCLIPVWDSAFRNEKAGWTDRWLISPSDAQCQESTDGLTISANNHAVWLEYANWKPSSRQYEPVSDLLAYNGSDPQGPVAAHDFYVRLEFQASTTGHFFVELWDGDQRAMVELSYSKDSVKLFLHSGGEVIRSLAFTQVKNRAKEQLIFSLIDRRLCVRWNGKETIPYDLPAEMNRNPVAFPFRLGARDGNFHVNRVQLFRDVYYRSSGHHGIQAPYPLDAKSYFMLGDNSLDSEDSRFWDTPGIPRREIWGKPFLLHQPSKIWDLSLGSYNVRFSGIDYRRVRFLR